MVGQWIVPQLLGIWCETYAAHGDMMFELATSAGVKPSSFWMTLVNCTDCLSTPLLITPPWQVSGMPYQRGECCPCPESDHEAEP
jgi:hypothetical protein